MSESSEDLYQCIGVCMADPETGVCMGCGRPPLGGPDVAIELVLPPRDPPRPTADPDTPE
ncbi:MAG: hypothetical protein ACK4FP_00105 [Azonexus sp.]